MASACTLPPLSAALVLAVAKLELDRDSSGAETCLATGIGALRRKLGFGERAGPADAVESVRQQTAALLAQVCSACDFTECALHPPATAIPPSA